MLMALIHPILMFVYIIIILAVMVTILLDNRQPAKTMAWLLLLGFLPVVGAVLYFFFGRNTRKERLISQRSLDQLTKHTMLEFAEQQGLAVKEQQRPLMQLFARADMALPFRGNDVEVYTDGHSFFLALLREIGQAKHHIHLNSYIFADDPLGNLIADALIDRAQQGVEVRLIYDDVGCWNVKNRFFERMREAGIDVRAFMPVRFPAFTGKVNYRNHRKVIVIDGRVGFTGGMNIALRYVKGTRRQGWRDTHIRLRGGAVYGLQRAFLVDWYFVDRTLLNGRKYYPEIAPQIGNNLIAQVVTSGPNSPSPVIMQGYVRILLEAKRYVYMETPYFLPTEPVAFAMRTAAQGGIDVRLMIPLHADSHVVDWASRSYVVKMVEAGVKVYLYKAAFNHSKLLVSDDSLSTIGSSNIDFRSFENNFEANVFFYGEDMARRVKGIFLTDQRESLLLNDMMDTVHRPLWSRLWESLMRLLSPLL